MKNNLIVIKERIESLDNDYINLKKYYNQLNLDDKFYYSKLNKVIKLMSENHMMSTDLVIELSNLVKNESSKNIEEFIIWFETRNKLVS